MGASFKAGMKLDEQQKMELVERITRIEEQVTGIKGDVDAIQSQNVSMARDLHVISEANKGRVGFVAGIIATISVVWAALLGASHFFFDKQG